MAINSTELITTVNGNLDNMQLMFYVVGIIVAIAFVGWIIYLLFGR